jgi:outer membrane protein assembly factor BamB
MKKNLLRTLLCISMFFLSACGSLMPTPDNTLPPTPLVNFTPKIRVINLWSTQVGDGASRYYLRLQPAVAQNKVFVASYSGKVTAVAANNGKRLWDTNTKVYLTSGIAANAGRLFVGTKQGTIIALRMDDGQLLWQTAIGSTILATPATAKGVVLAKTIDGTLAALAATDGHVIWRFKQTVPSLILHASSQPQIAGNLALAGFANGRLAALRLWSGKLAWLRTIAQPRGITDIQQMVDIDVSPVVVKGVVYVATYQGYIVALDLMNGREIWRRKISAYAGIAADYANIYLADANSHVWAFDEDSGAVVWRQTKLQGRYITGPAVLGNYVVVADAYGYLHWLAKYNGEFAARNSLGAGVLTAPVVYGGRVYVYTRDGTLLAFYIA